MQYEARTASAIPTPNKRVYHHLYIDSLELPPLQSLGVPQAYVPPIGGLGGLTDALVKRHIIGLEPILGKGYKSIKVLGPGDLHICSISVLVGRCVRTAYGLVEFLTPVAG